MKRIPQIACMAMLAGCIWSCSPKPADDVIVDNGPAMKARYRILDNAFSTGDVSAIDTLLDANAVDHMEDTSMHLPKGPEGLKQMIKMYREASPDMKSDIKMMVAEGDLLMVYGTTTGTNTGPMMGMPATGKTYSSDFVDIIKFGPDLKMTEHWGLFDQYKMMNDLGLIPSAPPPTDKKGKK